MLLPHTLMVQLTDKCNLSCRHCIMSGSPSNSATADLPGIRDVVMGLPPHFEHLALIGGEPFLFMDAVLGLARCARDRGISTNVNTNGFWGRRDVSAILHRLKDAGVSALSVSVDKYHVAALGIEPALTIAAAMRDACIEGFVFLTYDRDRNENEPYVARLREANPDLRFVNQPVLPLGRGHDLVVNPEIAGFPRTRGCRGILEPFLLTSRDLHACCIGAALAPGSALSMGIVDGSSVALAIAGGYGRAAIRILGAAGPVALLSALESHGADGRSLRGRRYVSDCHLCHAVCSDPVCRELLWTLTGSEVSEGGGECAGPQVPDGGAAVESLRLP